MTTKGGAQGNLKEIGLVVYGLVVLILFVALALMGVRKADEVLMEVFK